VAYAPFALATSRLLAVGGRCIARTREAYLDARAGENLHERLASSKTSVKY